MGPLVVDDLQYKSKKNPFAQGEGIRGGSQSQGLANQVGMGLESKLNPGYLVAGVRFLGKDNEGKKVVAVEEPTSTEEIQHVKDAVDVDGSRR